MNRQINRRLLPKLQFPWVLRLTFGNQKYQLQHYIVPLAVLGLSYNLILRRINNFSALRRRIRHELQYKYAYLIEWFQQNKDWIEDALTVFFSGMLAVNVLSLVSQVLSSTRKMITDSIQVGFSNHTSNCDTQ